MLDIFGVSEYSLYVTRFTRDFFVCTEEKWRKVSKLDWVVQLFTVGLSTCLFGCQNMSQHIFKLLCLSHVFYDYHIDISIEVT